MVKVAFETVGCSANYADSEQMAGLLQEADFEITEDIEQADIVVINTCTVKGPTETKFFKRLAELKDGYKQVVIAGCIAQSDKKDPRLKGYPLIGTKQIHKVVEVLEEALNDNIVRETATNELPPLNTPIVRKNPIVEIIPISRGCLGYCSFCKTKSARGNLVSYPVKDIVQRAEKAIGEGVKEIWLTSQDTGCYGFDIETDLPALLEELVKLPGKFKIRIGMMNPDHMNKIQDRLIEVYKNRKIFKFLHLPVQTGDDEVLTNMKRHYTVKEYKNQIRAFKAAMPLITIMTDVIVGFPGETEEQYWNTLTLVRETSPDAINISRFWPRPNTPAEQMEDRIQGDEIKRRSKVLTEIFHNIALLQNERWRDWQGPIIIDEKGKNPKEWIGRNESYKQVIVHGDYKLGQVIKIKINKVDRFALLAKEINVEKNNEKVILRMT